MIAWGVSCFTLSAAIKASSADTVTLCRSPAILIPTVNSRVISGSSCRLLAGRAMGPLASASFPARKTSGLLAAPGEEIALVEDPLQGHDGKIGGSRAQVTRAAPQPAERESTRPNQS